MISEKIKILSICLAMGLLISSGATSDAVAQDRTLSQQQSSDPVTLRAIPIQRGRLVTGGRRITSGSRTSEVTCCTNWNTQTGGTGCATYTDQCDRGQFRVDCGPTGCW